MSNEKEELERICINCNSFFPADSFLTEYGICLIDESFEPYIDELFENSNYDCCRDLINNSKFDGNRDACKDFEPIERIEIDDEIGERIRELEENNNLKPESLKELLLEEAIKKIDWKNHPVESYIELLQSGNQKDIRSGINSLGGLIGMGNNNAFIALYDYYKKLPPAKSLEDVYFKINILRKLDYKNDRKELADCLVDELYKTPSNNTTRSLILEIFKIMKSIPVELKKEGLERMLKDKRFSHRLKRKMEDMLYSDYY
ncbi:MAG: hypothetical protein FJ241_07915 [Nitrospira sp.]|nr:hypothetical protein [Nitrospira sp.]